MKALGRNLRVLGNAIRVRHFITTSSRYVCAGVRQTKSQWAWAKAVILLPLLSSYRVSQKPGRKKNLLEQVSSPFSLKESCRAENFGGK
jgi:hypothetical protein